MIRGSKRRGECAVVAVVAALVLSPFGVVRSAEPADSSSVKPVVVAADSATAAALVPPPAPPMNVSALDATNDAGGIIMVRWELSPDDARPETLTGYHILRSDGGADFTRIASVAAGSQSIRDTTQNAIAYTYKVVAYGPGGEGESDVTAAATSSGQWFNRERWNVLVLLGIVGGAILFYIWRATRGDPLFIRKIAGMDAVAEAVGRATEMGKPVLYIAGIQDMDNVQTVAGLTILGSISKMIAEYETHLVMPTSRSLVMSTARETVKEAYLAAGRPDAYREDSIYYVTDEQFGFVAHVDGLMLRQKPAACFYLGAFFAESLILAETGNSIGAIQIAGTAMPTQLPFFVAACDYTLIGEELFAASAYLSRDEKMLGSLKGQDMGKLVAMIFIAVGSIVATLAQGPEHGFFDQANVFLQRLWSASASGGH